MQLPIRLVPRKWKPGRIPFYLLLIAVLGANALAIVKTQGINEGTVLFLAVLVIAAAILSVDGWLRSRPSSPFFHIELTAFGFKERSGYFSKRFLWSEIKPFSVTGVYSGGIAPSEPHYYVTTSPLAQDNEDSLMIDAAAYVEDDDSRSCAEILARWLDSLRQQAIDPHGPGLRFARPPAGLWEEPIAMARPASFNEGIDRPNHG